MHSPQVHPVFGIVQRFKGAEEVWQNVSFVPYEYGHEHGVWFKVVDGRTRHQQCRQCCPNDHEPCHCRRCSLIFERPIDSFGMAPVRHENVRRIGDVKRLFGIDPVDNKRKIVTIDNGRMIATIDNISSLRCSAVRYLVSLLLVYSGL